MELEKRILVSVPVEPKISGVIKVFINGEVIHISKIYNFSKSLHHYVFLGLDYRSYEPKEFKFTIDSKSYVPKGIYFETIEIKRHSKEENTQSSNKLAIFCWEGAHNPLGRSLIFENILEGNNSFQIKIFAPIFGAFGEQPWNVNNKNLTTISARSLSEYIHLVSKSVSEYKPDIILSNKYRLPSIIPAIYFGNKFKIPLLFDVDEEDLFFERQNPDLPFKNIVEQSNFLDKQPYGHLATSFGRSLIKTLGADFVSNPLLVDEFGGQLVPHAKNSFPTLKKNKNLHKFMDLNDTIVIGYVGSLKKGKLGADLIRLIESIDQKVILLIAGTIDNEIYFENLFNQINNKKFSIITLSKFNESLLPFLCAIPDGYVYSSDQTKKLKNLPSKVIDALNANKICFVGNNFPFAKLIDNKSLFENERAFLNALISSRENQSKKIFQEVFDTKLYIDKTTKILETKQFREISLKPDFLSFIENKVNNLNKGIRIFAFWKQNDFNFFGRRHDKLLKALSSSSRVKEVHNFDPPLEINFLEKLLSSNSVKRNIVLKSLEQTHPPIYNQTLVYSEQSNKKETNKHSEVLSSKYYTKIQRTIKNGDGINILYLFPHIEHFETIIKNNEWDIIVADIVDNELFFNNSLTRNKKIYTQYKNISKISDILISNNPKVAMFFEREFGEKCHILPNGYDAFIRGELLVSNKHNEKYAIYTGNMNSRFDYDLLFDVAKNSKIKIVCIGEYSTNAFPSEKPVNINFLGPLEEKETITYISNAHFAFVPHLKDELSDSMDPLKFYNYLSFRKVVLTTNIIVNEQLKDNLLVAKSKEQFKKMFIKLAEQEKLIPMQTNFSKFRSWDQIATIILDLIDEV